MNTVIILLMKWLKFENPVDFNDLKYDFKDSSIPSINFFAFKGPLNIFKKIYDGDVPLEDVEKEQIEIKDPKNNSEKQKKTINNIENLYKSREEVVEIFNDNGRNMSRNIYYSKQGKGLKILTPKQMLQRLAIALAQIKAGNNSQSLLNEIRQIVYSLYQSKEIAKKVYNNIIKSIRVQYKMDTIFINSENSKTSEYHVLVLKRRGQKSVA